MFLGCTLQTIQRWLDDKPFDARFRFQIYINDNFPPETQQSLILPGFTYRAFFNKLPFSISSNPRAPISKPCGGKSSSGSSEFEFNRVYCVRNPAMSLKPYWTQWTVDNVTVFLCVYQWSLMHKVEWALLTSLYFEQSRKYKRVLLKFIFIKPS